MPERTPWWLLLLRMLALAAAILAFAGPVLNPRPAGTRDPLLVLVDGGWGDAPDWSRRMDRAAAALDEAARTGRQAAVVTMAARPLAGEELPWRTGAEWRERLAGLSPAAWAPDRAAWADWIAARADAFETLWLEDGIGHGGEAELARALLDHGPVTVVGPPETALALAPPRLEEGEFRVAALRAGSARAAPGRRSWRSGRIRTGSSGCSGRPPASSPRGGRARPRHRPAGRAPQPGGAGAARRRRARRPGWCWRTTRCGGARSG